MMKSPRNFYLQFTLFSFVFIINTTDSSAQTKITGIVKDKKTAQPLGGTSVYISDERKGTTTNDRGEFIIKHISEGRHLIEISHIGYATIAAQITIQGETNLVFDLTQTVLEHNAVVVTGVTKATQIKKIPFQVSVLRKDDLLKTAATNIIEAIGKQPGISTVSTGPAISKPQIRGLGYNRVLTIHDGVRQEGQQWGDEHGIEIDEASVQNVEILKGPASLMYGSDAMAGVIHLQSYSTIPQNTIRSSITSSYFTNNHQRALSGNIFGNKNSIQFGLNGSVKYASDYRNRYDGYVFNSKFNEQNMGGMLGYNGSKGYTHILVSRFHQQIGMVEGERNEDGGFIKELPGGETGIPTITDFLSTNPRAPYQQINHQKAIWDNSLRIGEHRLQLNLGYQQNKREEFGNPDDLQERAMALMLNTITYNTLFHLKEINGWKNTLGMNGMHQNNKNKGLEQLIPDYTLMDMGAFIYTQKELHHWNLSGGIRFDHRSINASALMQGNNEKGTAFEKTFSNFSGSIGATYPLHHDINLKLNAARAFRAPSLAELATNGAHEGTIRYEYGNLELKSETSTQWDAAVEFNSEHISINLAGYLNQFENFIFYRKLQNSSGKDSIVVKDGQNLTAFSFSQERASMAGVEANIDFHPHPLDWLHIENSFSMTSGRFGKEWDGSSNMPFMPAPRLITEIRAEVKKMGKHIRQFYTHLEFDNNFSQSNAFTGYHTETATKAYTLVNAEMGAIISTGKQSISIYLLANNLFDVAYQNHLNRLKYAAENPITKRQGVFNMGRNFAVRVNMPFNWKWK